MIERNLLTKLKYTHRHRKQTWLPKGKGGEDKLGVWDEQIHTAAKLLQSCPTLCDPIDGSPPGSSVPGILQARTLEWVAISFSKIHTTIYKIDNQQDLLYST